MVQPRIAGRYNAAISSLPISLRLPIIQFAIDVPDIDAALHLAEIGVKAGVDWLEAGTPLIVRRGADAIGATARAFPEFPVLADYKTMDSGGKNVHLTQEQGGHLMTVCAGAADETIFADVVAIGHPLISGPDPLGMLKQYCERVREAYKPRGM